MQLVDLVQRQLVDVALDLADVEEVPGHVEHRAAVAVARGVLDGAARDEPGSGLYGVLLDRGREELAQGLHAVEEPGRCGGGDGDAVPAAVEAVSLVAQRAFAQPEPDASAALGGDRQPVTGGGPQDAREVLADLSYLPRVVHTDAGVPGDAVRRSARVDRGGGRNDLAERARRLRGRGGRRAGDGEAGSRHEQQRAEKTGRSVVLSHMRSLPWTPTGMGPNGYGPHWG
uniref:Uncharacterized protein n=1 Tax=Streptomyces avermitilis TaxID=33903 RepID=A0A499VUR1_STRAX|nr:hypothetical protein SAVMC3_60200 [Streptomyces avermitilis]